MKWHDAIEVAVRIKHLEEKCNSLFCKVFGLNQRRMFIIKRLWIDSMENRDAYGYEEIGVVQTKDEADRIKRKENQMERSAVNSSNIRVGGEE